MTKRAAVIGSGFGGLALAIRLQAAGITTTLVEKREIPGGRAYVYRDKGYTFDAGPTVITDPNCLQELFTLSSKDISDYVDLIPVQPFYRLFWENGDSFDYSNDLDQMNAQIKRMSPVDVEGYRRFLDYTDQVLEEGYIKLADAPFLNFSSMVRAAPELVRLQAFRSVYSMVSHFIKHPQLRQAFSFHSLLVGGNPFSTSAIYTLIHSLERRWGVYFARGGTNALVSALVRLFEDIGGTVRFNCPAERILTRASKVTGLACGDGFSADFDAVASNADIMHTYRNLLADEPQATKVVAKLEKKRYSMSLFLVYFGTRSQTPGLSHHNVIFGSRYRELLADIFTRGKLANDFSLYLHAPSRTDPSLAPEGGEAYYALSPVPHLGKADIDWETEGPRYRDRILEYIESRYIPGLRDDIVTSRIFTPADFEQELNAYHGSAFSLEPVLTQSAYFRTHNRDKVIGGLYFTGAGTHPGAGIPGVVSSAKATARLMLADLGIAPAHHD